MQLLASLSLFGVMVSSALSDTPRGVSGWRHVAASADTVREYRGLYESGFEISWFHPCEGEPDDDIWWVTLTDAALRQRDSLAAKLRGQHGAVYVRWRGTISPKMPAGHMGRGSRYMLISEVLEVRPSTDASCATT